ncbi:hypothetical protein ISN45_Aa07g020550 [Arabidopsis thaliana x Arabidopsis arenosa]|uniref:Uncharacterized protein n=1 Tax=Arabidopsis thaliana x Arabidopsis arenosa TaxID=1240361 RepID=A0A8T1Y4F4_9BRAS|nr:hypothetical protein ISN45_Aa07g020550 [Arabidopsis thaliana x Arabidopsis arenosa]
MKSSTPKLCSLKYSCEEVYERMENGLCVFCEEEDTPGHQQLKHKSSRIVIMEREDDLASDVKEEAHQILETVTNPEPIVETANNSDPFIEPLERASVLQVLDSVPDFLMAHKVDSHVKEVEESSQQSTNGNDKIVAHQLFDQMPNEYQKDLTVIESSNKEVLSLSHKDARVWEPGGLPTNMDHWDWSEKEMKPYGESHQVATFLYFQMQVVKSNPAEFKTFDKTLSLEVEQNDEHEQNQVRKLISSWNNQVWEPGGVSNEQDVWKWLDKRYEHSRVMRLMQQMSNTWWSYGKMAKCLTNTQSCTGCKPINCTNIKL